MTKETTAQVEEKGMSQKTEDLVQLYKTLTFDLPLASMRWAFGSGNDKESTVAVWKGYDAGVRLATSTIDSLYRSQSLSEVVGTTVNQMLRIQQLSNAASRFFMTGLWRPLSLSTVPEEQTLAAPRQALNAPFSAVVPVRPHAPATRRSHRRKTRIQEPVQQPTYPLPQQDELQVAA